MSNSEWNFPASVQLAINWVDFYLLNPNDPDARPVPRRVGYGWFTSIKAGPVTVLDAPDPEIEIVDRCISFYLGQMVVVRLRMRGLRHHRHSTGRRTYTEWAPSEVEYKTEWIAGQGETYREELIGFPTDLPAAIAEDD
jgi:hypothetical protein